MRVTFLGTGAAGGVPLFGCNCAACVRAHHNPQFRREPCSALVESGDTRVLIDGGLMDLHRRFAPGELDAIVLTHFHPDHIQGLFHLRWGQAPAIAVHIPPDPDGNADLFRHPGLLDFRPQEAFVAFEVGSLRITPVPLNHSKPTFGYAFAEKRYSTEGDDFRKSINARFAYLTDTCGLPTETRSFLGAFQPGGLALDCTFPPKDNPKGHNDWPTALDCIRQIAPARAWLTHIRHDLDAWLLAKQPARPLTITVAVDGEVTESVAWESE